MAVARKNWMAGTGHEATSIATWTVIVSLAVVVFTLACLYLAVQRERAAAPPGPVTSQAAPSNNDATLALMPVGLTK